MTEKAKNNSGYNRRGRCNKSKDEEFVMVEDENDSFEQEIAKLKKEMTQIQEVNQTLTAKMEQFEITLNNLSKSPPDESKKATPRKNPRFKNQRNRDI